MITEVLGVDEWKVSEHMCVCVCRLLLWMGVDVVAVYQCLSVHLPPSPHRPQPPSHDPPPPQDCAASAEFPTWSDRFPDLPL